MALYFRKLFLLMMLLSLVWSVACESAMKIFPITGSVEQPTGTSTSAQPARSPFPAVRSPLPVNSGGTATADADPTGVIAALSDEEAAGSTANPPPDPTIQPTAPPQPSKAGYKLDLNENFDGPNLNMNVWNTRFRSGTTNPPELQEYVPDAVKLQSGNLQLTADRNPNGMLPYTSGMIASYDLYYFQYGYVEIRAKAPKGKGFWPSLWMLAIDPKSANEIDIMELVGSETDLVHTTLHYGMHAGNIGEEGTSVSGPDFSQDFHIFAIDWQWDKVTWFIDGKEVFQVTEHIPREPMFLIANLAVGGDWPGAPDQNTPFPASFDIDYIHVFIH
jgi:beta-glucanase (GH16 family)